MASFCPPQNVDVLFTLVANTLSVPTKMAEMPMLTSNSSNVRPRRRAHSRRRVCDRSLGAGCIRYDPGKIGQGARHAARLVDENLNADAAIVRRAARQGRRDVRFAYVVDVDRLFPAGEIVRRHLE